MSLTRSWFRKRIKTFSAVAALFLTCYLGFLLPAHHHEDGQDHTDCVVCIAQSQPAEAATVFCLSFISLPVFVPADFEEYLYSREYRAAYHPRAPPLAS